jgi:uncharacterized membrane protein
MNGLPAAGFAWQREGGRVSAQVQAGNEVSGLGGRGSRRLLAVFFIGGGVNHFVLPGPYRKIVPPRLREQAKLVVEVSGVAEVAGGLGVLLPATRRLSGLGLIALLVAVFPANLHMARAPEEFPKIPRWALYGRLALQPLMMWWAWRATRR